MKKAFSFAVALGLVAGMASSAVASDILEFKGTGRLRGLWSDVDGTSGDEMNRYDQRYRFNINAKLADNVMVGTRMTLLSENMSGDSIGNDDVMLDRAYMKLGILGGTWILGRQEASWGNKFMVWGATKDRIKAVYSLGGGNKVGAFTQKDIETNGTEGFMSGDKDTLAAFFLGSAGDTKFGVIAISVMNDSTAADDDGMVVDGFVNMKAGGLGIAGEVTLKSGDAFGTDDDLGFFVGVGMGMGEGMNLSAAAAFASNGFTADDDFTPTLLFGTSQVTGIANFGGTQTVGDDTSMAVLAALDMKLSSAMSAKVLGAYAILSDDAETTLIEIDASIKYALASNTTYMFGAAIGMPDKYSADDEMLMSIGHQVQLKW